MKEETVNKKKKILSEGNVLAREVGLGENELYINISKRKYLSFPRI